MKDRLKKKLKAKKILGNKERNSSLFKSNPVKRKEYEMPEDYKENLGKLTELLDQQAEFERILPTLPPDVRAEAMPHICALNESIEEYEQLLAEEYEDYQKRRQKIDAAERAKIIAGAQLQEQLERMFIVAKHKLEPEMFKNFESSVMGKLSPEDREEFYDAVAIRESYDLENILADPNGKIKKPMKHPFVQQKEAIFEIDRIVYKTDDFFKQAEAEYEKALAIRDKAEADLLLYPPAERKAKRLQIEDLDRKLEKGKQGMMNYLQACFAEDGKTEVENPDEKKLNAAFEQAEIASDRVYLMIKHTTPHLLEKFEQTSFLDMTPEEIEAARERIAKRETEELDEILAAVKGKVK